MLRIRPEQLAVFAQVETQKFEDWTITHLKRFFPRQCATLDAPQLRELVRHGIRRSTVYGITAKNEVCKYSDLMVVLGRDFDTDSRLSWAGDILNRREDPAIRVRALQEAAKNHLRRH